MSMSNTSQESEFRPLTKEDSITLKALNYPTKPIIIDAKKAFSTGILERWNEHILFSPKSLNLPNIPTDPHIIPSHQIYSAKLQATMEGLNEALVRAEEGEQLRDLFEKELHGWQEEINDSGDEREYGLWAYYPRTGNLAQFPPKLINRLALVSSNSSLHLDPARELTFTEAQKIHRETVVSVMGLSVGNSIIKSIVQTLRPDCAIIGDPKEFKTTNQNRVLDLTYDLMTLSEFEISTLAALGEINFGTRNKAQVTAEQLHAENPLIDIFCYQDGVTPENENIFLVGSNIQPRSHIAIDVADTTSAKIGLAVQARKLGIRYIRVTDAGDSFWVDVRPFDINQNIPISPNSSDDELMALEEVAGRSKKDFFAFASALIGPESLRMHSEFSLLIKGKLPKYTASIPQLGVTTMAGGGFTGNMVARMRLGHPYYERMCFDMRGVRAKKLYQKVPGMHF